MLHMTGDWTLILEGERVSSRHMV